MDKKKLKELRIELLLAQIEREHKNERMQNLTLAILVGTALVQLTWIFLSLWRLYIG